MDIGGRPTKLNDTVQGRICEALSAGNTRMDSAAYAGVSYSAMRQWMARGKAQKRGIFQRFVRAVLDAEGKAAIRNVAIIQKAATKDWKAAAFWLERRRRRHFGRKDYIDATISGKKDAPPITIVEVVVPKGVESEEGTG